MVRETKEQAMTTTAQTMTVEMVPIGDLRPDPFNPRKISDAELEALTRSLQQFGFVTPVVARREDKTVIGGHQRLVRRDAWAMPKCRSSFSTSHRNRVGC